MATKRAFETIVHGEKEEETVHDHVPFKPQSSTTEIAHQLWEKGVAVFPVCKQYRVMTNDKFDRVLRELPEFNPFDSTHNSVELTYRESTKRVNAFTIGGFGALNVPSSLHHIDVRKWRHACYESTKPILRHYEMLRRTSVVRPGSDLDKEYVEMDTRNIQCLFDRLCVRPHNTVEKITTESWHRDEGPTDSTQDIFGGWMALDDQVFSCIPGTQKRGHATEGLSFNTINIDRLLRNGHKPEKIVVPKDHIILFNQNIVHEVAKPTKRRHDLRRLFTGYRLTCDSNDYLKYDEAMTCLGAVRNPSGNIMPNYAKLHWTNGLDKLLAWSSLRMNDNLLVLKRRKSGLRAGVYKVPPSSFESSEFASLKKMHEDGRIELDEEKFPEYGDLDRSIMLPHKL